MAYEIRRYAFDGVEVLHTEGAGAEKAVRYLRGSMHFFDPKDEGSDTGRPALVVIGGAVREKGIRSTKRENAVYWLSLLDQQAGLFGLDVFVVLGDGDHQIIRAILRLPNQ